MERGRRGGEGEKEAEEGGEPNCAKAVLSGIVWEERGNGGVVGRREVFEGDDAQDGREGDGEEEGESEGETGDARRGGFCGGHSN